MQQPLHLPVINSLENLFKSKKDYDVIIQAGEDNDQKEIYAHSNILRYQSDYFDTAFSDNRVKRKDGKYFFEKPNISPYILEIIIRHLYCGQLNLKVMNGPDILKLLVAIEELGLDGVLSEYIQEFLIEDQNKFSQDDCIELLNIVFQHGSFTILEEYYLKTICQVPAILFGTDKILSLPAKILELLLKRDDLALDEIELWNNLVSRDGYKASVFHEKCNDEGSIIIIGIIRGTNQIVGGYKPFYWEGPGVYKYTRDSFVFFFNDYRYIDMGKIGKLIDEDLTLICNGRWMPIFGKDLAMQLNGYKWTSSPYAHPNLNIPNNFEIDDYEVFQILLILLEININERTKQKFSILHRDSRNFKFCFSENDECIIILMSNNYLYFGECKRVMVDVEVMVDIERFQLVEDGYI
ncbi:hypothetical protein C1646_803811 [Rhizophagus diaphanus]|nr:hypothetical protein C1646_803811 [Rhizophagus diaphanus] [Rhizophagus sp. MUCL 43196]